MEIENSEIIDNEETDKLNLNKYVQDTKMEYVNSVKSLFIFGKYEAKKFFDNFYLKSEFRKKVYINCIITVIIIFCCFLFVNNCNRLDVKEKFVQNLIIDVQKTKLEISKNDLKKENKIKEKDQKIKKETSENEGRIEKKNKENDQRIKNTNKNNDLKNEKEEIKENVQNRKKNNKQKAKKEKIKI